MATIRQLPSGSWNVQIRKKGKIIATSTLKNREDAFSWAEKQEAKLVGGGTYFVDAGYAYCHQILQGKPSHNNAMGRITRISKYSSMQKPMSEISLRDINAFKLLRLAEVSPTTCLDELLMIRRVFRWHIAEHFEKTGEPFTNPCEQLRMPKPLKPRDRVVSRDELYSLLKAMSPQMALIVEFAYETAMRRGEILKLRPKDLFLNECFLRVVDGKEGSRDVPLNKRALELLSIASQERGPEDRRLFSCAPFSVSQAVRRARKSVGMDDDVRFHQLRHSRITEVARNGLNQAQIMIVSGHRDIRSVQRYTHLNVKDVIDLID